VAVRGEAGIDKCPLVGAATELAERNSAAVLELNGSPFHTDVGLHPIRALIDSRCGIERSTDAEDRLRMLAAEIRSVGLNPADMVPFLVRVVGVPADGVIGRSSPKDAHCRKMIVSAVGDYLAACAGDEAALLVAEYVHWFDPSSLEILGTVLRGGTGRLMVMATGREFHQVLADEAGAPR
jgi:hypothetical protein